MMRYIERTVATVQHAAPNGFLPRVVVQVSGGLGNQIFSTVNALILAMFSQRALVVVASGKQQYEPEAVFDISSAIAHVPCRTRSVLSLAQTQGYEYLALEDWSFDGASSEVECIFLEEIMEDPYLWFVNAGVRQFLADSFRGRHFFFLSHFIYLGASVLDSPVDIISQPSAQVWDESRTLGEALAAIHTYIRKSIYILTYIHTCLRTSYLLN
jgi:hypothetical protein